MRTAWLVLVACAHREPAAAPTVANTSVDSAPEACTGERCLLARTFVDIRGISHGPAELAGRVVVIGFFATWAEGSHNHAPLLSELGERYRDAVVLAISIDESVQALEAYNARMQLAIPIVRGSKEIALAFHADVVPLTFVFDRHGALALKAVGLAEHQTLTAKLDQLILAR